MIVITLTKTSAPVASVASRVRRARTRVLFAKGGLECGCTTFPVASVTYSEGRGGTECNFSWYVASFLLNVCWLTLRFVDVNPRNEDEDTNISATIGASSAAQPASLFPSFHAKPSLTNFPSNPPPRSRHESWLSLITRPKGKMATRKLTGDPSTTNAGSIPHHHPLLVLCRRISAIQPQVQVLMRPQVSSSSLS